MADFSDILSDNKPTIRAAPAVEYAIPGTILRAKIILENWEKEGDIDELDCGSFEIDTCDLNGPPDVFNIKAVSVPLTSSLRREEKCIPRENTTLEKVAQSMAQKAELRLMYEVKDTIELDRLDQLQRSDLSYLQELCNDYGVSLKVTNDRLVLFEEADYEQKDIIETFDKANKDNVIKGYSFSQCTSDTVCKTELSYKDPKSGKLVEAEFEPPEPPATGQVLRINDRPGDLRGDSLRNATGAY